MTFKLQEDDNSQRDGSTACSSSPPQSRSGPQGTSQDLNMSVQVLQLNFMEPSQTLSRSSTDARATASSSVSAIAPVTPSSTTSSGLGAL